MAIQVTDPRNNLLGQLTAVGQQFLANRQEMRRDEASFRRATALSEMDFNQRRQLAELLNTQRVDLADRKFEQELALADFKGMMQAGADEREGAQRLAEIDAITERFVKLKEERPDLVEQVGELAGLLGVGGSGSYGDSVAEPPLTEEIRAGLVDLGGEEALGNVLRNIDDPMALQELLIETEGNPIGRFLAAPVGEMTGRNRAVRTFIEDRVDYLKDRSGVAARRNQDRGDLIGLLQIVAAMQNR